MMRNLTIILLLLSQSGFAQQIQLNDLRRGSIFLVNFGQGSSDLDEIAVLKLQSILKGMEAFPSMEIEISGHTSVQGNAKANQQLSETRVSKVEKYLLKNGADKKRILSKAYGPRYPISMEVQSLNRRVEIMVLVNRDLTSGIVRDESRRVLSVEVDSTFIKNQELQSSLRKVAMVIGNSRYKNTTALKNPINDAKLMSTTLQDLGFEVFVHKDLNYRDMIKAIKNFSYELNGADVVLFYYAGHGLQLDGESYLLPIDTQLDKGIKDLRFEAINTSIIFRVMEYTNKNNLNMIILDACRNDPFTSTRSAGLGLAEMNPPSGSLIAFSTSPGSVAFDGDTDNSIYTSELAQQMQVSQRVEDVS